VTISGEIDTYSSGDEVAGEYVSPEEVDFVENIRTLTLLRTMTRASADDLSKDTVQVHCFLLMLSQVGMLAIAEQLTA
jgi:hypothetical protein